VADTPPALELPDPNAHIPYRIVGKYERQELTPDNRFLTVVDLSVEGPSGSVITVTVPKAQLDPAAVDRQVQDELHASESIHALGPAPHPENLAT
jgi:hypothetical protein